MPEATATVQALRSGYVRQVDIVPLLGVTHQRVSQIGLRDDFPEADESDRPAASLALVRR